MNKVVYSGGEWGVQFGDSTVWCGSQSYASDLAMALDRWVAAAPGEIERLQMELSEAKKAARFLYDCPSYSAEALAMWPWLEVSDE